MKTNFLFIAATAAIALILLSSCEKDINNQELNTQTPIDFVNPRVVGATKALEVTTSFDDGEKIGIYASSTDKQNVYDYMKSNTEVTYSGEVWGYSPKSYWPVSNATLNFFAYHPYSVTPAADLSVLEAGIGTSIPSYLSDNTFAITHWVNTNPAKQTDLLWDWVIGATKDAPSGTGTNTTTNISTKLEFKHALSKVMFTTKLSGVLDEATKIYITDLKINANQKGSFTTISANTTASLPTWNVLLDSKEDFIILSDAAETCPIKTIEAIGVPLNITNGTAANYELLMLPQTVDQILITLKYKVVTTANSLTTTVEATETFKVGVDWEQGSKYTYHFAIGLHEITFTGDVAGWIEGTSDLRPQ